MDEAIYKTRENLSGNRSQENIIFSPISLSGTMAIVLLAAGGKTFDEVAKILGLESGVDVSRNSEVVHEMFGLLLSMIDTDRASNGPQASYANGIFIQVSVISCVSFRNTINFGLNQFFLFFYTLRKAIQYDRSSQESMRTSIKVKL